MEDIEQDQKVTHYLTYFNIFTSEKLFQDYQSFLEKLVIQLGEDWRIESNILWDGHQNGEGYPHIFNIFLSVFLEGRLNREYLSDLVIDSDQTEEQQKSIERFNEVRINENKGVEGKVNAKVGESLTFQTLSVGFFVTAAEIWNGIFMEGRRPIKERTTAELKPFATSIEYQPSETIKRLRKLSNTVSKNIKSRLENSEFVSHSESRFSRQVSSTQLVSKTRQSIKNVSWKSFRPSLEEIPCPLLTKVKQEIEIKQTYSKWQMLSNFMVNILEVEEKNKQHQRIVRVIRVNREFYHTTAVIWLLINNKKNYLMKFNEFESFVALILKDKWKSQFSPILKLLFDILTKQWNQITKEHAINLNEDYEVMKIFIERVKKSLGGAWNSVLSQINMELLQI